MASLGLKHVLGNTVTWLGRVTICSDLGRGRGEGHSEGSGGEDQSELGSQVRGQWLWEPGEALRQSHLSGAEKQDCRLYGHSHQGKSPETIVVLQVEKKEQENFLGWRGRLGVFLTVLATGGPLCATTHKSVHRLFRTT